MRERELKLVSFKLRHFNVFHGVSFTFSAGLVIDGSGDLLGRSGRNMFAVCMTKRAPTTAKTGEEDRIWPLAMTTVRPPSNRAAAGDGSGRLDCWYLLGKMGASVSREWISTSTTTSPYLERTWRSPNYQRCRAK